METQLDLKFRRGQVIRYIGDDYLMIVSKVRSDSLDWISFNSSNCSGGISEKTVMEKELCYHCNEHGRDSECEECGGLGHIYYEDKGLDKVEVVAESVGKFIQDRLNKLFYDF